MSPWFLCSFALRIFALRIFALRIFALRIFALRIFALRIFALRIFAPRLIYASCDDPRLADRKNLLVCSVSPGFLEQSLWWLTRRRRRLAPLPSPSP